MNHIKTLLPLLTNFVLAGSAAALVAWLYISPPTVCVSTPQPAAKVFNKR